MGTSAGETRARSLFPSGETTIATALARRPNLHGSVAPMQTRLVSVRRAGVLTSAVQLGSYKVPNSV
jgi:hypothetical protein